jgi:two-component system, NarL family, sensor histidine kinase UhpB
MMNGYNNIDIIIVSKDDTYTLFLKEMLYQTSLDINRIKQISSITDVEKENKKLRIATIFVETTSLDDKELKNLEILPITIPIVLIVQKSFAKKAFELLEMGVSNFIIKDAFDEILLEKAIRTASLSKRTSESLHLSNERYKLVSKATNDIVWDWDLQNNKVFRSEEGWGKIFGEMDATKSIEPDGWRDRIHPNDIENSDKIIGNILKDKSISFFEIESRIRRNNNTYANILDRGYALRNDKGEVIRLIGAAKDITEKKELEKKLNEERRKKQNEITNAVITAQEKEREALGKELHDNINQILATTKLYIEYSLTNEEMRNELLETAKVYIGNAVAEIRSLSKSLVPPSLGEVGITMALDELIESVEPVNDFKIISNWKNIKNQLLSEQLKLTIFRIAQEQLNNISKHAKAKNVSLTLSMEKNNLHFIIEDDGVGFDATQKVKGVGLQNIFSRANLHNGKAEITSTIEKGCTLSILFKL